jgi:hypothetical protein
VLTSLLEIGAISSIFWSAALVVRWQAGHVLPDEDESDEDEDDAADDDEEEEIEEEEDTCPGTERCPFRAEIQLTYGLENQTIRDTLINYALIALGAAAAGFLVGIWIMQYPPGW